jgi:ribonucleoside-diphosphate reductase alpha chain
MLDLKVVKRTGDVVDFDRARVKSAVLKATIATGHDLPDATLDRIIDGICAEIQERFVDFYPNVENVQDIVEKHLMRDELYGVAKAYILYRADRQKVREAAREQAVADARLGKLTVVKRDGRTVLFNVKSIEEAIRRASQGCEEVIAVDQVVRESINNVYDGIPAGRIEQAMILATTGFIELDPAYSLIAARLLLQKLFKEVVGRSTRPEEQDGVYRQTFVEGIRAGVAAGQYDARLAEFDLERLAAGLRPERDLDFQYLGLQTLYERYFMRRDGQPMELPQVFWMRVAMGLAIEEADREGRALEFYALISTRAYVPSTPTLFHAGSSRPQLSSCYITTVDDDLLHIFKSYADNAQLSKWSGGIGNDWSSIRATGAPIKSTNVESQGVIPFLKIANDVTNAINRSGKRRGATCAYLETWHYDIEDFLDLRKNTGDDRRRTHDMNTANWIPDLFIKRVIADGPWTLFSPDEVPDLHHLYGQAFEARYTEYEARAGRGEIHLFKTLPAKQLWRKMLTMLFETGHPWITFKDACNIRSPQDHAGVIHSSNLCTEITLNTSAAETAVCNLGSINLAAHIVPDERGGGQGGRQHDGQIGGRLDEEKLARTVRTAIRMLDNVIDINYYPTDESRAANMRHRPIGLGIMGLQDAFFKLDLAFESPEALEFADSVMERVAYHAILASSELAGERGAYPSYVGSKWDRGIFPLDTLDLLERERGVPVEVDRSARLDWVPVRAQVRAQGMRNSNTMAIAPTATISNIAGCYPSFEPIYKNLYVKANISGEFTVVNRYLVDDLKRLGLWGPDMLDRLKYCDGNVSAIEEIPPQLRAKYREAFEIDPLVALRQTAARGKWIDQSQSHNVFMAGASGKLLSDIYLAAWRMGLKTTYYLRTMAVSQIEKSTLDAAKYGFTQKRDYGAMAAGEGEAADTQLANGHPVAAVAERIPAADLVPAIGNGHGNGQGNGNDHGIGLGNGHGNGHAVAITTSNDEVKLCRIDDPDCEACQ